MEKSKEEEAANNMHTNSSSSEFYNEEDDGEEEEEEENQVNVKLFGIKVLTNETYIYIITLFYSTTYIYKGGAQIVNISVEFERDIAVVYSQGGDPAMNRYYEANPTHHTGLTNIIANIFTSLNLIRFYTCNQVETRVIIQLYIYLHIV